MQVWSRLVVLIQIPLGCQASPVKLSACPVWIVNILLVRGSQMIQLPSRPVVARRVPSGCHSTAVTAWVWPVKVAALRPVVRFQMMVV